MFEQHVKFLFDKIIAYIFIVILLFIMVGIAIGVFQLFGTLWLLFQSDGITGKYIDIISDVLTLYVLVELSRSLVEYFDTKRIRLTFIIDAAIVFVIREVLIGLFKHAITPDMLYALSALIFVLGVLRVASILLFQRETSMFRGE
jgi:uncharacterized membrane protein (DUF373 family)